MRNDVEELAEAYQWEGFLTRENADAVAKRIKSMICNGQAYTFVEVEEFHQYRPEVQTGVKAHRVEVHSGVYPSGPEYCELILHDMRGMSFLASTAVADRREATMVSYGGTEDSEKSHAYRSLSKIKIEEDQIRIEQYNPAGQRMYWVIALEGKHE